MIEHIYWQDYVTGWAEGLLEVYIYWHGGGFDKAYVYGTVNPTPEGDRITAKFGEILTPTGSSGMQVMRVGRILR